MDGELYYDVTNGTVLSMSFYPTATPLLDSTAEFIFRIVFFIILSAVFGIFGTGANIINIIVFIRQGLFSGGSTLNLFFLNVADLGVVFTNLLHSIGFSVVVADIPDLPFDPFAVSYLTIGWPNAIFMIANRIMTAYIAFERCMCVVLPFRVKSLFTPRKSLIYIMVIFTYSFVSHVPIYLIHRLGYAKQEENKGATENNTKLILMFGPNRDFWHDVVYYANSFVVSFGTVIMVFVCTIVTIAHINISKKWRKTISSTPSTTAISTFATDNVSSTDNSSHDIHAISKSNGKQNKNKKFTKVENDKEARLVKMIVTISIIFLVCYTPELMLIVMKFMDDRIRVGGQYSRLAELMYSIVFVMSSVNSSINIFVYYAMSTKYRNVFLSLYGKKENQDG